MIRAALGEILDKEVSHEIRIRFATRPDLISGVELIMNGYKLAWNVADYLASLENAIGEVLKTSLQSGSEPESEVSGKNRPEPEAQAEPETGSETRASNR
jgi:F-type H+-transporting ATPase subunit b